MQKYIVTYAQNATPVHAGFWQALQTFCRVEKAELIVLPGRYRNPTSRWSEQQETDEWWAEETVKHLCHKRRKLCKNLTLYGDISIQPTANRPLSSFEVFVGESSAIFGHTKRACEVVATSKRQPRVMWTTSACTVPNYTDSKAGRKGKAHHVLGAVVVEVDPDGVFFVRHVSARKDGSFVDLDTEYGPKTDKAAPRAASVTLGDWHAGREDEDVLAASEELVGLVKPKFVVLHDLLDFQTRNHHDRGLRPAWDKRFMTVESEVQAAAAVPARVRSWGTADMHVAVVRSNHDEAFERWAEEFVPSKDPVNASYWFHVRAREFNHRARKERWPNLLEMECRHFGADLKRVLFLGRNESLRLAGVEHGFHGDKGLNGSRGSPNGYIKLGVKVNAGHTHVPHIADGLFRAGVTAQLDHEYNVLPSSWAHAQIVTHADGKRQLVFIINGRYRGGQACQKQTKKVA